MKYLVLFFVLLLPTISQAQTIAQTDDRYFDSRKIYSTGKKSTKSFPVEAFKAGITVARGVTGIVPELAAKAQEIINACGSRVISGVRVGSRVRGSGRLSLHHSGQAVDMAGNPSCIYAQLANWPGGYSTDYNRVAHVHISYGGSEHGLRFRHR